MRLSPGYGATSYMVRKSPGTMSLVCSSMSVALWIPSYLPFIPKCLNVMLCDIIWCHCLCCVLRFILSFSEQGCPPCTRWYLGVWGTSWNKTEKTKQFLPAGSSHSSVENTNKANIIASKCQSVVTGDKSQGGKCTSCDGSARTLQVACHWACGFHAVVHPHSMP